MTTIDGVASLVILVVLSALAWAAVEHLFPSDKTAEGLGYMPDSEAPKCGWPLAWALGLAVVGLLLFGPTMAARIIGL